MPRREQTLTTCTFTHTFFRGESGVDFAARDIGPIWQSLHHHLIVECVHDALTDVLVGDHAKSLEENEDVDLGPDVRDCADLGCHGRSSTSPGCPNR